MAILGPAVVACAVFALHAACGGRYGVFRDELYFIACGERLAAGYVDQPPLVAVVARVAHSLFGLWVPGLRLASWVAAALLAFLAGRLAARLGGGAFAATLAAVAVGAAPVLLALGHYLTMNAFEPVLWTALALLLARLAQGGDARLWYAAGLVAAAGVLFKYSMAPFAIALTLGLLATPARQTLLRREAAAAALIAALLVLPNLLWQVRHGLPFLELVRNGQRYKNAAFSPGAFAGELVLEGNPLAAPLWAGGLLWLLLSARARPFRFLGLGAALLVAFLVLSRAKPYYLAPLLPLLFAGGAVGAEALFRKRLARGAAVVALAAVGIALAPMALPLLPVERFVAYQERLGVKPHELERLRYGVLPQLFADQFGWEELARAVAGAAARLSPAERERAAVFARNYGEAAALELFGAPLGVPPVASGHNQYWVWGPPPGRGEVLLVVSDERETCGGVYRERALAARLPESPWVMPYESGMMLWLCRGPSRPLAEVWRREKHFE
jgi:4-amino-4-deoxy-L-arabinose transferase-like glycosyltransferase